MPGRKKPPAGPSLFGGGDLPDRKKPAAAKPNPLGPYFEAFERIIGKAAVAASRARVGKMAKQLADAKVGPERVAELPDLIRRYAKWRTTLDVGTVQACVSWLIEPPKTVAPDAPGAEMNNAVEAIRRNNGERPF